MKELVNAARAMSVKITRDDEQLIQELFNEGGMTGTMTSAISLFDDVLRSKTDERFCLGLVCISFGYAGPCTIVQSNFKTHRMF